MTFTETTWCHSEGTWTAYQKQGEAMTATRTKPNSDVSRANRQTSNKVLSAEAARAQTARLRHEEVTAKLDRLERQMTDYRPAKPQRGDVYHPGGPDFFADVYAAQRSAPTPADVEDRLRRHEQQMQDRDATAASFAGMVPPGYLTEAMAESSLDVNGTARYCRRMMLPPTGMTVEVPTVDAQPTTQAASQLAAGSETDPDINVDALPVRTVRGAVDMSYAAAMRSDDQAVDLIVRLLGESLEAQTNDQVLNGNGTAPNVKGLLAAGTIKAANRKTDHSPTTPTPAHNYWAILERLNLIRTGGFLTEDDRAVVVVAPRRWHYMHTWVDSDNRPVFVDDDLRYIAGARVISDTNMPVSAGVNANEDIAIAAHTPSLLLFESPPVVMQGDPDIRNWRKTVTVGKYLAFGLRFDYRAATVQGTAWATTGIPNSLTGY